MCEDFKQPAVLCIFQQVKLLNTSLQFRERSLQYISFLIWERKFLPYYKSGLTTHVGLAESAPSLDILAISQPTFTKFGTLQEFGMIFFKHAKIIMQVDHLSKLCRHHQKQ